MSAAYILHKHSSNSLFKFLSCNYRYVKKTPIDRTFINGTSYHLLWVFQSVVVLKQCACGLNMKTKVTMILSGISKKQMFSI